ALVHEPVVIAAQEDEVVDIGRTALAPMDDVVRGSRPAPSAAGERAAVVATLDLTQEPGRNLAGRPSDADRSSVRAIGDDVPSCVAQQPARRLGGDCVTILELGDAAEAREDAGVNMQRDR